MALVRSSNTFQRRGAYIDDGLAADRPTADPYTRGANGLRREGVIPNIN